MWSPACRNARVESNATQTNRCCGAREARRAGARGGQTARAQLRPCSTKREATWDDPCRVLAGGHDGPNLAERTLTARLTPQRQPLQLHHHLSQLEETG
eukprot:7800144-Lingulodinium_polyedra.AAC.1